MSSLKEFTGSRNVQLQRTAETAVCVAAQNLGWVRQMPDFAKVTSCAFLTLALPEARQILSCLL
ncbi:hypothetical protein KUV26_17560 [Leisingera daeponensis]|uniref:Uncharacterized protein n=1 Tax=Leisingera daeponensis TaxID=405746 RepID=A0ABS7NJ70_9RHOB|nr:hypothetical protein [Leisingera daeponensis]MBY6141248.1 hypothetical protein [Leisingera daeponensis]